MQLPTVLNKIVRIVNPELEEVEAVVVLALYEDVESRLVKFLTLCHRLLHLLLLCVWRVDVGWYGKRRIGLMGEHHERY